MHDNRLIQVLDSRTMRSFIRWVNDDKDSANTCPVFLAQYHHPDAGTLFAYAKIYTQNQPRGLINEIVGYLACHATGVAQPDHAFLMQIDPTHLPHPKAFNWSSNGDTIAFCTSRLDGPTAGINLHNAAQSDHLTKDIVQWSQYAKAVTTDETIASIDRHVNNLIRLNSRKYAIIDNGILVNAAWRTEDLHNDKNYDNQLYNYLKDDVIQKMVPNLTSSIILNAEDAQGCYNQIESELDFWLSYFLPEHEKRAFLAFIQYRNQNASCLIKQRTAQLT